MVDFPVHLVGSIPLESPETVFESVGKCLSYHCKRIPDGETGVRKNWIGWQRGVFADQRALIPCEEKERDYQLYKPFKFDAGRSYSDLRFDQLGFAREALRSFTIFEKKQEEGVLPANSKFLVAMPTPFAPVYSFISYGCQEDVFPIYEAALFKELDYICKNIPHHKLAVQWDVATEMSIFEKVYTVTFKNEWEILIDRLSRLGNHVPLEVEIGFHLCYGSMNNRHWKEPNDLGMCVKVANSLAESLFRHINFIHMPVPVSRNDEPYFHPLLELLLTNDTELYLGLVHDSDTLDGNLARMETASKYIEKFGIATECGLGRRNPTAIPRLLRLQAQLAKSKKPNLSVY